MVGADNASTVVDTVLGDGGDDRLFVFVLPVEQAYPARWSSPAADGSDPIGAGAIGYRGPMAATGSPLHPRPARAAERHGRSGRDPRFYDRCSCLMRELLDALAGSPPPRPFPQIEDSIGWPQRRIALGAPVACPTCATRSSGPPPLPFLDDSRSESGRLGDVDGRARARAVHAARRDLAPARRSLT